jgi:putative transcriptional regulator
MPIKYDKLFKLMQKKGVSKYKLRKDNIIGQATLQELRRCGDVNTSTIRVLCRLLKCQPGDIMEYVSDNKENI